MIMRVNTAWDLNSDRSDNNLLSILLLIRHYVIYFIGIYLIMDYISASYTKYGNGRQKNSQTAKIQKMSLLVDSHSGGHY